jgi:hypothetical protein
VDVQMNFGGPMASGVVLGAAEEPLLDFAG